METTLSAQLLDNNSNADDEQFVSQNRDNNRNDKRMRDNYCWSCHQLIESTPKLDCKACVRAFHTSCLSRVSHNPSNSGFICPECVNIMRAEEWPSSSSAVLCHLNGRVDQLIYLLIYAIETVKAIDRNVLFHTPVDTELYPDYCDKVVKPMDLSKIEANIRKRVYASTNSFLADIKWIHHNCIVYNPTPNEYTKAAEKLLSKAVEECDEMEACVDCYRHYFELQPNTYFREPCSKPHGIVWAKVCGYPYWPAKAIKYHSLEDKLMVTFFGTHDKCLISLKHCYLISEVCPAMSDPKSSENKEKKFAIKEAMVDLKMHITLLDEKWPNLFRYWPPKTAFTTEHLYLRHNRQMSANKLIMN